MAAVKEELHICSGPVDDEMLWENSEKPLGLRGHWWWPGGRMYDVIYFTVWSDIICTAA